MTIKHMEGISVDQIIVKGGQKLKGKVRVEGAKNAVLPVLAGALLASKGKSIIKEVPNLADVYTIQEALRSLNVQVEYFPEKNEMLIDSSATLSSEAQFEYVRKMRASILVMGPVLARNGFARVALPGGCAIGSRPIDQHLKGFEAMGAEITSTAGYVEAKVDKLKGAKIYLDFPSVGATQNIMMAAVLAEGVTTLENVAREPEIVDLANFLNKMGAKVIGAGTETIKITGVEALHATGHTVISDRIEAGTFMVAAAVTNGNVFIEGAISHHNKPLISKLSEMGVEFEEYTTGLRVIGPKELKPTDVKTLPYPGFPTDMQAQMSIAQLLAPGSSALTETVFENRFMHFEELRRMSAKFTIERQTIVMYGPTEFSGASVKATDLRAAAALIIAGLVAKGLTRVSELKYLDRGYYRFHEKLANLGANIERVNIQPIKSQEKAVSSTLI